MPSISSSVVTHCSHHGYPSPFHRYGFPALVIIEFGGRDILCSESDANDSSIQCPQPGADVLASFGIQGVWANLWLNVLMLVVLQVVLRVLTYALLRRSK